MMTMTGAWGDAARVSWKSTTTTARIALPFDLYPDPLSDCRPPYQQECARTYYALSHPKHALNV
jgi:hypothetical protein